MRVKQNVYTHKNGAVIWSKIPCKRVTVAVGHAITFKRVQFQKYKVARCSTKYWKFPVTCKRIAAHKHFRNAT